jgi:hypothetical protein
VPYIPVIDKSKREDGSLSREDFTFDKERNVYVCPQGKRLHTTGKINDCEMILYWASTYDCGPCPLKSKCAQKRPSAESRAVSMRMPVTLPESWPRPKRSSNQAVTGSALRCCLRI